MSPPEPQGPRAPNPVDLSSNGWAIVQKNARKSRSSLLHRGWGLFLLARKLQVGFRRVAWGLGWQSTTTICRMARHSLSVSQDSNMRCWDQSLCAGEDWGLSEWCCLTHWTSSENEVEQRQRRKHRPLHCPLCIIQGRSETCRQWLGRTVKEVIIKGMPNTSLPDISAWCTKGQMA